MSVMVHVVVLVVVVGRRRADDDGWHGGRVQDRVSQCDVIKNRRDCHLPM